MTEPEEPAATHGSLIEVALIFLRLGATAFGGPAAHIAMMRDELVRRRRWVSEAYFLDLLGVSNIIPGPSSTELATHLGYVRAGWPGLIVGGACFIAPAMTIVLAIAWAYVTYRALPEVDWLLYGIKPVIIAIVAYALWGLLRTALKTRALVGVAIVALLLAVFGLNEIAVLALGALAGLALARPWRQAPVTAALLWPGGGLVMLGGAASTPITLGGLFLTFLKIGAVLYGSGYVLLAFLRTDLVERLGWMTESQLLDAIAVGQFTPGPVFTTATFIGYTLAGAPGALAATLGIFLPSFFFVALTAPFVLRLRRSPWTAGPLDGVNAAAVALMAYVTWSLASAAIVDLPTALLAVVAFILLLRVKLNSAWLVIGGGLVGIVARLATGG